MAHVVDDHEVDPIVWEQTTVKIRLHGIDCPETRQNFGSRAKSVTFLLEAEITGRLEHPGVVPVSGLGPAVLRDEVGPGTIRGQGLSAGGQHQHVGRERSSEAINEPVCGLRPPSANCRQSN